MAVDEEDDEVKVPLEVVRHRAGFPRQLHAREATAFVFNGMPAAAAELAAAERGAASWMFPDTRRFRQRGLVQEEGDAARLRRQLELSSEQRSARAALLKQFAAAEHRAQEAASARCLTALGAAHPEITGLVERSVLLQTLTAAAADGRGGAAAAAPGPSAAATATASAVAATAATTPPRRPRPRPGVPREAVSQDYLFFLREGRSRRVPPQPSQSELSDKYMAAVLPNATRLRKCRAHFAAPPTAQRRRGRGLDPAKTDLR